MCQNIITLTSVTVTLGVRASTSHRTSLHGSHCHVAMLRLTSWLTLRKGKELAAHPGLYLALNLITALQGPGLACRMRGPPVCRLPLPVPRGIWSSRGSHSGAKQLRHLISPALQLTSVSSSDERTGSSQVLPSGKAKYYNYLPLFDDYSRALMSPHHGVRSQCQER